MSNVIPDRSLGESLPAAPALISPNSREGQRVSGDGGTGSQIFPKAFSLTPCLKTLAAKLFAFGLKWISNGLYLLYGEPQKNKPVSIFLELA
jgi:hypothetical protein